MICETFGAHPLGSDRVSIEGVSSETFGGEPLTSEGVSAIKKAGLKTQSGFFITFRS